MNPQIEITYKKLEDERIIFDRTKLEEWCFEAATLDLEKDGKQKTQANYDKEFLSCLQAALLMAYSLPEDLPRPLYLEPYDDYRRIAFTTRKP